MVSTRGINKQDYAIAINKIGTKYVATMYNKEVRETAGNKIITGTATIVPNDNWHQEQKAGKNIGVIRQNTGFTILKSENALLQSTVE